jgi:predicted nucleotidyltransferase
VSASVSVVFRPRLMLAELLGHDVEFILVGGLAVQVHGHVRFTRDLDIVPAPDLLNLSRLEEALAAMGGDPPNPHRLRRAPHLHAETDHGPLDILNIELLEGVRLTYERLRSRAEEVEYEGRTVLVAGLDDLIRMKRVAGREVDLSDIGALTRTDAQLQEEAQAEQGEAQADFQDEAGEST